MEFAFPKRLQRGDKIRFVSPASPCERADIEETAESLRAWGLEVDFGEHAFNRLNFLAGTDEQRPSDFNTALRDPQVRAIFATRGGKGSYRIADRLDFAAARRDPKFVVGFSDITILQLALWRHGIGGGVHGAFQHDEDSWPAEPRTASLHAILMGDPSTVLTSRDDEETSGLTTSGTAQGRLVGGNLDMITTSAGWALPKLDGCILLIEAVNMFLGQVDRQLSMLIKGGHLNGVAGIALGQFTDFKPSGTWTVSDLLREHLGLLGVPILGGLPLGHGAQPRSILMGGLAVLDAEKRELRISW